MVQVYRLRAALLEGGEEGWGLVPDPSYIERAAHTEMPVETQGGGPGVFACDFRSLVEFGLTVVPCDLDSGHTAVVAVKVEIADRDPSARMAWVGCPTEDRDDDLSCMRLLIALCSTSHDS